jgi:hypothetical protein
MSTAQSTVYESSVLQSRTYNPHAVKDRDSMYYVNAHRVHAFKQSAKQTDGDWQPNTRDSEMNSFSAKERSSSHRHTNFIDTDGTY